MSRMSDIYVETDQPGADSCEDSDVRVRPARPPTPDCLLVGSGFLLPCLDARMLALVAADCCATGAGASPDAVYGKDRPAAPRVYEGCCEGGIPAGMSPL